MVIEAALVLRMVLCLSCDRPRVLDEKLFLEVFDLPLRNKRFAMG